MKKKTFKFRKNDKSEPLHTYQYVIVAKVKIVDADNQLVKRYTQAIGRCKDYADGGKRIKRMKSDTFERHYGFNDDGNYKTVLAKASRIGYCNNEGTNYSEIVEGYEIVPSIVYFSEGYRT